MEPTESKEGFQEQKFECVSRSVNVFKEMDYIQVTLFFTWEANIVHVQSVDCLELFGEEIQPTHSPGMIHTSTPAQVSNHEI